MTIRFLQTTRSAAEGVPFMPGQVIHLAGMTAEARAWIRDGRAELVQDTPEAAVVEASERAVVPRAKGHHARAAV